jgi:hypothetical protein
VIAFHGKDYQCSNFYPCKVKVFGENYASAEHAYQLTKAIRLGDMTSTEEMTKTALEAKKIGKTVRDLLDWISKSEEILPTLNKYQNSVKSFNLQKVQQYLQNQRMKSTWEPDWMKKEHSIQIRRRGQEKTSYASLCGKYPLRIWLE